MIRKVTLLFLLCVGVLTAADAQPKCGFDIVNDQLLKTNAAYAKSVNDLNAEIAKWTSSNNNINSLLNTTSNGDTVIEIPVVVHIMHTGGATGTNYNPTDAQIIATMDYVNKTFNASWTGYPTPGNGGTKFPIQFVLAKRDPSCSATTGITRTNVSTTYSSYTNNGVNRSNTTGVNDPDLKALSIWPQERYYNIWVVNRLDGVDGYPGSGSFIAGYAYFPGAPAAIDGTVMLASQMNINKITLPHELGHAFSLYHTFQGSVPATSTCPTNTTCATDGDRCCDTQPHYLYGPGTCNSGNNNACVTGNFDDATAKNIMNYANCQDRFTADQRTRFMAAAASTASSRSALISSSGSLAPSSTLPTACVPAAPVTGPTIGAGPASVSIFDANRDYMKFINDSYDGVNNLSYMDYTCKHQVRLRAGNTYDYWVSSAPSAGEKTVIFIDYNNDGILGNSAGERIDGNTTNGGIFNGSFTVPFTAKTCAPIRMRVRGGRTSGYIDSCTGGLNGQTEDYEVLIYGGNGAATTLKLDNPPIGGNPSCFNADLTFTARPTSTVTVIGYKWYINDTVKTGHVSDTFNGNTIFKNNDTVKAMLYYSGLCGVDSVMSDSIIVKRVATIAPAVTIGITGGTIPTCIDDTVTLEVINNVNPGGGPTYQWKSNGTNIPSASGPIFKAIGRGGESITVEMTSTSTCASPATATSNAIPITYTTKAPVVQAALTIGTNPGCAGQTLQFTATPVTAGGTAPTYQWNVNGNPVATGVTFSSSTLNNGDDVSVIMTSNSPCAVPTIASSAPITITHSKITADITVAQSTGTNPICEGKPVIFSANTTNAGKSPGYQWLLNGQPVNGAKTPIYLTDSLRSNDIVQCVLIATDLCVANPLDTSNAIIMIVTPALRPTLSISITAGKHPGCLDSVLEFTATATDLGASPEFTWLINGFPAATGQVFTTNSLLDKNFISARANQTDGGCYIPDTVSSDSIEMVLSPTPKPAVISLIGNTIYTNFDSSFIWFGPDGQMPDGPEGKAYPGKIGTYWAVTNNRGCWSKPSNYLAITLLDISSLDISGLDVYPNPTTDKLVLDWNGQKVNYSIVVHNAVGQIVMQDVVENQSRKELSMGNLPAGNYFIMLKDEAGKVNVVRATVGK